MKPFQLISQQLLVMGVASSKKKRLQYGHREDSQFCCSIEGKSWAKRPIVLRTLIRSSRKDCGRHAVSIAMSSFMLSVKDCFTLRFQESRGKILPDSLREPSSFGPLRQPSFKLITYDSHTLSIAKSFSFQTYSQSDSRMSKSAKKIEFYLDVGSCISFHYDHTPLLFSAGEITSTFGFTRLG